MVEYKSDSKNHTASGESQEVEIYYFGQCCIVTGVSHRKNVANETMDKISQMIL